jgi:hypothetical protein
MAKDMPSCSSPLGSRTSRPSAGLVSCLPRRNFIKKLSGVVDVASVATPAARRR